MVDKLVSELVMPMSILAIGQWVAIGVGAGLVAIAALFSFVGPCKIFGRGTSV